jgi:outer membrane protein OmpA-like peptidoglycan-associated protein
VGAGDYRALAFLGWSPEVPAPPPDRDSDGVADARDICVNLPGVASEDPLMNGCPSAPLDTDGDGIPDAFDACPREAGVPSRLARSNGCPKLADRDADAIPDRDDACPDEKGIASADAAKNGCPAPPPPAPAASLVEEKIVISEQVQFETGTAVIRSESDGILSQVARVFNEHPKVELVEVEGHTDDTGAPELNRRLSQERAEAVRAWLIGHGVASVRLVAKGYGQTRPIDDNATEAGRARNRRVEFRVVRGPGSQETPR